MLIFLINRSRYCTLQLKFLTDAKYKAKKESKQNRVRTKTSKINPTIQGFSN